MKIRVILTGATGMVGEGVLHECLKDRTVDSILVMGRRPCGVVHPKLKEIVHHNFYDLSTVEGELNNYNTCIFCLGVSSVGMNEVTYARFTYELTLHVASTLLRINPGMTFCYISGAGTDSTMKGKSMWARVKGKTENELLKLGPGNVYLFRPGYLQPTRGLKHTLKWYVAIAWLYPVWKTFFPKHVSTLKELGMAMIHTAQVGYKKPILEVKDIIMQARLYLNTKGNA
jgi:hypothetical protein